jgi:hypothetical protein
MLCHDFVEEVKELAPASAWVMAGFDLAADHIQSGEQGGGAVTLVTVTEPIERRPARSPERHRIKSKAATLP